MGPAAIALDGPGLDVALHLTINLVFSPAPLLSDNRVVEMPQRRCRSGNGQPIYAPNMSLDGWTEDEPGAFDWAAPDDDVFASITDLMRSAGTTSTGGACTTRWPSGKPTPAWLRSRSSRATRERLAGGGQNRLLHDPGRGVNRQHAASNTASTPARYTT